jgi:hypothetical protein
MQLKTILNRVQKHRSFVYGKMSLVEKEGAVIIELDVYPRANRRPQCSQCG